MSDYILEMQNIVKEFPGVKALNNVNFKVERGEIHCLVGENGAGKSTLMKVLSGVYPHGSYNGNIIYNGSEKRFKSIADSEAEGIAIIYQELALIPELSVYENIYFGHEIMEGKVINWNQTIVSAQEMLKMVKLDVNPSMKIKDLSVGKRQLVEIAKALSKNVKLLVLDEPTAALNEDDSANLLELLKQLRETGVTSIMISHKLKEVVSVADTITVIRDGSTICSMNAKEQKISEKEIIKHMVGREIENIYPKREKKEFGDICLDIKNWTVRNPILDREILHDVNINVRKGEIIGIAGLMGSGRTELALSIFGNTPRYQITSGELYVEGAKKSFKHPKEALEAGVAYVSEDRKGNGLVLIQDIKYNISIANLEALTEGFSINENKEINIANDYKKSINIKAPSIKQLVGNLSGGNQQKVSLAKCLFVGPKVLILDEPTRGIDVGAKFEIYSLMNKLVEEGMSIIMISSELLEVLGMSDRVYVMSEGSITGCLSAEEATEQSVMALATRVEEVTQ
ncbi:MAG: Monosaccharide-transporting ATPase [Herbinix sp.]|jgi:putative multiple sugar transport system ATP-binding protein|nr:Monosaccharide-transporting ATPase [Herbinix sp.]